MEFFQNSNYINLTTQDIFPSIFEISTHFFYINYREGKKAKIVRSFSVFPWIFVADKAKLVENWTSLQDFTRPHINVVTWQQCCIFLWENW